MSACRLLADIGGTNARFARSRRDRAIFAQRTFDVAEFADFGGALQAYLADTGPAEDCESAAIGAAGPVLDGEIRLTNIGWRIIGAEASQMMEGIPTGLFNDLEAVALALPHLEETDLRPIGSIRTRPPQPRRMLAINVGTGFGAAVAFDWNGHWITCPSEAGHMSFGAQDAAEFALRTPCGARRFTVEDALSGDGLVRLYRATCRELDSEPAAASGEDVIARVANDIAARTALSTFTRWLGRAASDLVLATSAWGGVFLTGGVIRGWHDIAPLDLFRKSFEAEGKMQSQLSRTYTAAITRDDVALLGLASASVK